MADNTAHVNPTLPAGTREATFIIVPAFNESACIGDVLRRLTCEWPNTVIVDDGSTDRTLEAARGCAKYLLRHPINRGQGAALQTGIEFALRKGAQYVVTFDSDGQHEASEIPRLLAPIVSGECEIALGSRFLGRTTNMPFSRRFMLRAAVVFTRMMSGASLSDTHNGFRAFSRKAAECVHITLDRMAHASELIDIVVQSRLPYKEVPVSIRYTDYSLAKGQTSRGAIKILFHYIVGRLMR